MAEGLQLAVIGLVVVFAFLTALVLAVQTLGWLFRRYGHLFPEGDGRGSRESPGFETARVAAAIGAIEAHRRRAT